MVWLMSCLGCSIDEYIWFYKSHLHIYYPWMGCGLHYDILLLKRNKNITQDLQHCQVSLSWLITFAIQPSIWNNECCYTVITICACTLYWVSHE